MARKTTGWTESEASERVWLLRKVMPLTSTTFEVIFDKTWGEWVVKTTDDGNVVTLERKRRRGGKSWRAVTES
jgi:hypothetical protein